MSGVRQRPKGEKYSASEMGDILLGLYLRIEAMERWRVAAGEGLVGPTGPTGPTGPAGVVALAAVGAAPNANAATLTGSTLNLELADPTYPGLMSTSVQSFGGTKTFSAANVTAAAVNSPLGGTGVEVSKNGAARRGLFVITADYRAWSDATGQHDAVLCSLPAKCRVVGVIADTTIAFGGMTPVRLSVGITGKPTDFLLQHDVDPGTVTKGLVDGDLGANFMRSAAVQAGLLQSWTAATNLVARIDGPSALSGLNAGSTTFYVLVERMD